MNSVNKKEILRKKLIQENGDEELKQNVKKKKPVVVVKVLKGILISLGVVTIVVGVFEIFHYFSVKSNNKTNVDGSKFSDHTINEELTTEEIAENEKNLDVAEYKQHKSDKDYEEFIEGNTSEKEEEIKKDERYLDDTDSDEIIGKGAKNSSSQIFSR